MNCRACEKGLKMPEIKNEPSGNAVKKWAVGITTAPRRQYTLATCVESVKAAGWEPIIYAEPGSKLDDIGKTTVVQNETRLGAWFNWLEMCRDLLRRFPDADAIFTIQDDVELVDGVREFIESNLWPSEKTGVVSLYTPKHYANVWDVEKAGHKPSRHLTLQAAEKQAKRNGGNVVTKRRPIGCYRVVEGSYWGACALIFPRYIIEAIVSDKDSDRWRGVGRRRHVREPHEVANVDTVIGRLIRKYKKEIRTYTPSLASHFAYASSIGHGDNSGRRNSIDYVGRKANVRAIFERETNRTRYYLDGSPKRTGDPAYDTGMVGWHKKGFQVSMSISPGLWKAIRKELLIGRRFLELGSGMSTTLLDRYKAIELVSLEQDAKVAEAAGGKPLVVPIDPKTGWYKWKPEGVAPFDIILIDGPQGEDNRAGILEHIEQLAKPTGCVIYVDDTHRNPEAKLAATISDKLGGVLEYFDDAGHGFATVRVGKLTELRKVA